MYSSFLPPTFTSMSIDTINQQLRALRATLQKEREEDLERYRREISDLTIAEKQERGLCWYPLEIRQQDYTFSERAFVIVERMGHRDEPHRFKSGSPVEFYSMADDKFSKSSQRSKTGVIYYVQKNKMKIILNSKDLPDWINNGQIGVDFLFDERTYIEMDKALAKVIKAKDNRLAELKSMFYGATTPKFDPLPTIENSYLNDNQIEAVRHILAAQDIAIVHGPPGTGKTTTLVSAIEELCKVEPHVLVSASSNTAVDYMAERLSEKGLDVVRIGNISRVDEKLVHLTLEGRLSTHPQSKNIKKVKIQAAKARRDASRFRRRFGEKERANRREGRREARDLEDWAKHLEDVVISEILSKANVVACTLINTAHSLLDRVNFRTLVIDEAAQALEPASWIAISQAQRIVLAGDPFQLPPTVKSKVAKAEGLGITLLEKSVEQLPNVNFLAVQYRMNKAIMAFSSQQFYNDQLIAAEAVANHRLEIPDNTPVIFIDTAGTGFEEELNPETKSRFNKGEYFILREHFLQFATTLQKAELATPTIAIISPYRAQCMYIEEEWSTDDQLASYLQHININTIDAFQGQERDVIYISLVRSNTKSEIGFLADFRRMNVALTRARKQLIVVGDSATVGETPFYQDFIEYVENNGLYASAWEYMSGGD